MFLKDSSADEVIQMCRERSAHIFGTSNTSAEQKSNDAKTDHSDSKKDTNSLTFRLPAFVRVHEITGLKQCESLIASALAAVSQGEKDVIVVGLDTEWGEGSEVTLLQIAFEKYCFLVCLVAYAGMHLNVPCPSR